MALALATYILQRLAPIVQTLSTTLHHSPILFSTSPILHAQTPVSTTLPPDAPLAAQGPGGYPVAPVK